MSVGVAAETAGGATGAAPAAVTSGKRAYGAGADILKVRKDKKVCLFTWHFFVKMPNAQKCGAFQQRHCKMHKIG